VIKYWLEERNVDGFRVDAVKHLFESEGFENEPLTDASKFKSIHDKNIVYNDLDHLYTANRPETYRLLSDWRGLFDAISRKTDRRRCVSEGFFCDANVNRFSIYYFVCVEL
jgi:glycosidase